VVILVVLVLLLVFLVALDQFSHLTITNVVKVSKISGLGKTTVGFLLLAFSTSLPELSVAAISGFTNQAGISIGNVIGSNIVNICLIIGLAALLVALRRREPRSMIPSMAKEELGTLHFGLFIASLVPLSLVYIVYASWLIGLVLIGIFLLYTYQLSKIRIPLEEANSVDDQMRRKLRLYVALTLIGVFGVVASSYFIVESAVAIAEFAGVPKTLIGATIIAFGTSLPEFSTSIKAFLRGHPTLALGNIIGSCFINITLILGITLVAPALTASPLTINMVIYSDLVIFSLIANLFLWYFLTLGRLSWREGAILLFIYILFLATTLGAIHIRPSL